MNDSIILDSVPFQPDFPALMKRLRIKEGSSSQNDLLDLLEEAQQVARPKVLYRIGYIEQKNEQEVSISSFTFTSRVLRVNLEGINRVFIYLCTCGTEIHEWSKSFSDLIHQFWAEALAEAALASAFQAFEDEINSRYGEARYSDMNPGSLEDWPIEEQIPLFLFLGDPQRAIGVELTPSLLMVPTKSVSGLRFPAEESFASCQLCPREVCPSRRAPYDSSLYKTKYQE